MEEPAPDLIKHKNHWYYHPFGIGLGIFFVLVGGGLIGLVIRAYSDVVKEEQVKFTSDPTTIAQSSLNKEIGSDTTDPYIGPDDATITLIEFGDFQCPFSKEVFPTIRRLMAEYSSRVRFVFRDYPVSDKHPLSDFAAQAGQCAWEQGSNQFWALHDRLYQNQDQQTEESIRTWAVLSGVAEPKFRTCLSSGRYASEVLEDYSDGVSLGVRGTPTFYLNDKKIEGAVPYDVFVDMIESELN